MRLSCLAFVLFVLIIFLPFASNSFAGKYNPVLSIGDDAPTWNKLKGTDDKEHSTEDLKDSDVLIVVFTCNTCPYAIDVEDRLNELANRYADRKVSLVAINSNSGKTDLLSEMKKRAEAKKFSFAYLSDETQEIAKAFGALRTPEFFVINRERKIAYMGAMDDSPDGKKITKRYLQNAVDAILQEKEIAVTETIAIGCGVRFKRKKRER